MMKKQIERGGVFAGRRSFRIGIVFIVFATFHGITCAQDKYTCSSKATKRMGGILNLTCEETDQLATGFIYGVHSPGGKNVPPKNDKKLCTHNPEKKNTCQAMPIDGQTLYTMQTCLWKNWSCSFEASGHLSSPCLAKPVTYLVAKDFQCVPASQIIRLCSSNVTNVVLSKEKNIFYILSRDYPAIVPPNLTCSLNITPPAGATMRFETLRMHLHPNVSRGDPTSECGGSRCTFDYLQLEKRGGPCKRYCGRLGLKENQEIVDFTTKDAVNLRFASGPVKKHYEGLVIRVSGTNNAKGKKDGKSNNTRNRPTKSN